MRGCLFALVAAALVAGCTNAPMEPDAAKRGPDVDVEVLAMHSRPLRVVNPPATSVKPGEEEEKPKPRRKRRRTRPKPAVQVKPTLPPDEKFTPREPIVLEPPIDIPADADDWAGELTKEFKRRDEERKRRAGDEGE